MCRLWCQVPVRHHKSEIISLGQVHHQWPRRFITRTVTVYSHHGAWLWNWWNWCQPLLEKCISRRQWKGLWRNEIPQRGKSQPSYLWTVDGLQQKGDPDIPLLSRFCSANGLLTPENRLRHITCSTGHLSASFFCTFFSFKVAFRVSSLTLSDWRCDISSGACLCKPRVDIFHSCSLSFGTKTGSQESFTASGQDDILWWESQDDALCYTTSILHFMRDSVIIT